MENDTSVAKLQNFNDKFILLEQENDKLKKSNKELTESESLLSDSFDNVYVTNKVNVSGSEQ